MKPELRLPIGMLNAVPVEANQTTPDDAQMQSPPSTIRKSGNNKSPSPAKPRMVPMKKAISNNLVSTLEDQKEPINTDVFEEAQQLITERVRVHSDNALKELDGCDGTKNYHQPESVG